MKPCFNLTGNYFGRWLVIRQVDPPEYLNSHKTQAHWLCRCDCGYESVLRGSSLRSGRSKSCGCSTVRKGVFR
jgi:hypothetical protein